MLSRRPDTFEISTLLPRRSYGYVKRVHRLNLDAENLFFDSTYFFGSSISSELRSTCRTFTILKRMTGQINVM